MKKFLSSLVMTILFSSCALEKEKLTENVGKYIPPNIDDTNFTNSVTFIENSTTNFAAKSTTNFEANSTTNFKESSTTNIDGTLNINGSLTIDSGAIGSLLTFNKGAQIKEKVGLFETTPMSQNPNIPQISSDPTYDALSQTVNSILDLLQRYGLMAQQS